MGVNKFTDLTAEEFKATYASGYRAQEKVSKNVNLTLLHPKTAPTSVDWTTKGAVTPVKDQGQCGSCWAFSTTGAIESAWAVAKNPLVSLSEQRFVSCDSANYGCDGGFPQLAMDYARANGTTTEASYPYASGGGTAPACNAAGNVAAAANVTGWRLVPGNTSAATEAALAAWVAAYGPVSIVVRFNAQRCARPLRLRRP